MVKKSNQDANEAKIKSDSMKPTKKKKKIIWIWPIRYNLIRIKCDAVPIDTDMWFNC